MAQPPFERPALSLLTEMERVSLRAILEYRNEKVAAIAIRRSENTLRTHLASARRKLGVSSSFTAAKLLAAGEVGHPNGASPEKVMGDQSALSELREDRAAFEHFTPEVQTRRSSQERINDLNILQKLTLLAVITAAAVGLLALTFPFSDGLQRWADVITNIRHRR